MRHLLGEQLDWFQRPTGHAATKVEDRKAIAGLGEVECKACVSFEHALFVCFAVILGIVVLA